MAGPPSRASQLMQSLESFQECLLYTIFGNKVVLQFCSNSMERLDKRICLNVIEYRSIIYEFDTLRSALLKEVLMVHNPLLVATALSDSHDFEDGSQCPVCETSNSLT